MKKKIIIGIIIILVVIIGAFALEENSWKKVNIESYSYYESATIELDLDGDKVKEKINLNKLGKYISINDTDYVINKYLNEDNDYNINQYKIVDLNGDGILEIIHRTFSDMISPSTSKYTIYNFNYNELIEIGNISIIGNIPDELYVKGNKIKFRYHPYESPEDYTEKVICTLNIDK